MRALSETGTETRRDAASTAAAGDAERLASAAWHAHRGEWHRCLAKLKALVRGRRAEDLPVLFESYFGHAIARCQRDFDEAERLCRRGVEAAFYRPEAHWNLASVLLLARDHDGARRAVAAGLALDADNALLLQLQGEVEAKASGAGVRSVSFLDWLRRVLRGPRD